jgi:hypothetical protein
VQCNDGPVTYRPRATRILGGAIFAICGIGLVGLLIDSGIGGLLRYGWWIALAGVLAWGLFWNPNVQVDDAGVKVVNVFRSITLPWPSIKEIDTKWSLTLITAYGSFAAWAAPAPGRYATRNVTEQEIKHLPSTSFDEAGSIGPGDNPNSSSGQAALAIRRRWEALRDAGHLDNPRLEFDRVPVRWHVELIVVLAALLVLGLVGLAL